MARKPQTIFVQIAAYRDPELVKTIEDMLKNAKRPQNLVLGICRQYHPEDEFDNLDKYANRIEQKTNQRINTEIQDLSQSANNDDKEIVKYIDSRVDKLEDKIYTDFDVKKKQTKKY